MKNIRIDVPELASALAEDGEAVIEIAGLKCLVTHFRSEDPAVEVYEVPADEVEFVREALRVDALPTMSSEETRAFLAQRREERARRRMASEGRPGSR